MKALQPAVMLRQMLLRMSIWRSDSVVEKVYVKRGDKVKIGDTLLEYDKTLLQLNLEEEQINKTDSGVGTAGEQKNDLEKLKKITPVPDE